MTARPLWLAGHGWWIVPLVLVGATAAVMGPIAARGSPVGHDAHFHNLWASQFARCLAAGVLYPRWLPDVNGGLGNPTFVFYAPLVYYVAALVHPFAGSIPRALDLAAWAALLLSGAAGYLYLRRSLHRGSALVGAVALVVLPYRLLDLYDRTALAEFAAFAWPPLVLLALRHVARARTAREAGRAAAAVAAATAGLALTHLPSLVLWGPPLAIAALASAHEGPGRGLAAARACAALALGLGLAGIYLVPALAERRFVQIEWLAPGRTPEQTLFSPEASWGNDKVSRIACWQAALAAVAAAAALWPRGGRTGRAGADLPVAGAAAVSAVAFFLMSPWSRPLWSLLPILPQIQFPWRLLVLLTPAAALLVACAAERLTAPGVPNAARALGAAALALLAANLVVSARDVVGPARLDAQEAARYAADPAAADDAREYRPRGAPLDHFPRLPRAASLVRGARADVLVWEPTRRVVAVDAPRAGWLRIATFYYPGWHAAAGGRTLPVRLGPDAVLEVSAPAGRHIVEVRFGSTPARRAGAALSAASGLGLAAWAAARVRRRSPV